MKEGVQQDPATWTHRGRALQREGTASTKMLSAELPLLLLGSGREGAGAGRQLCTGTNRGHLEPRSSHPHTGPFLFRNSKRKTVR